MSWAARFDQRLSVSKREVTPMASRIVRLVPGYRLLRTVWLDSEAGEVLRAAAVVAVVCPASADSLVGENPLAADRALPAVKLLESRGAVVLGTASRFETPHVLHVERTAFIEPDREQHNSDDREFVGNRISLVRRQAVERVPSGVFVGGNGAANYYHFVIEVASKLTYMPDRLSDVKLLVPEECADVCQLMEVLDVVRPGASIRVLKKGQLYEVDRLFWITNASSTPYNLRPGVWPRCDDTYLDSQSLGQLRNAALRRLASSPTSRAVPTRVMLVRPTERRHYNKDRVLEALSRMGFMPMSMETLSFIEQIRVFQEAEVIVGPSGAAWTNLLFGRPGNRALYWLPDPLRSFSAWSTLAAISGVDVRFITHRANAASTAQLYSDSYELDVAALVAAVGRLVH